MPLTLAPVGEESMIRRVGGKAEVRAHLENLGFVPGGFVTVIAAMGGNLIVNEYVAASKGRRHCVCGQAAWGRRCKAKNHGHGHHKGCSGACAQGGAVGRPDRGYGEGV